MKEPQECPQCHRRFHCGAGEPEKCWCYDLPNVIAVDSSARCLCPDCLKAKIEAAQLKEPYQKL
jgi:hypothetical protein